MKPEQVCRLYDTAYAASYDGKFLHSEPARPDTEFECELLGRLLEAGGPWLDVACGTGYFLSLFPHVERAGMDLSPAMLERAAARNPGVPLHRRDFRSPTPEWVGRWRLVSCMWYAYGLVDSMEEVERVVRNLAAWTADDGVCFVPLCDPCLVSGVELPYDVQGSPWPGRITITGVTWSYGEAEEGAEHTHMVAPLVPHILMLFKRYFRDIQQVEYPTGRSALLASGKRAVAEPEASA